MSFLGLKDNFVRCTKQVNEVDNLKLRNNKDLEMTSLEEEEMDGIPNPHPVEVPTLLTTNKETLSVNISVFTKLLISSRAFSVPLSQKRAVGTMSV